MSAPSDGEPSCRLVCAHGLEACESAVVACLQRNGVRAMPFLPGPGRPIVALCHGTELVWLRQLAGAGGGAPIAALVPDGGAPCSLEHAAALLGAGCSDVLTWSPDAGDAGALGALIARWCQVESVATGPVARANLVGSSPAWLRVVREVVEAALFGTAPVLLTGETGTGKELLARLLHSFDPRSPKRDLIVVDCTTLSRELSGSELFGHERGAFTGAAAARDGAVALADGGTLFLDEVGELPLDLQGQLLRALQERSYKRVGSNAWKPSSFRLVCATNRHLLHEVEAGRFRRDLYHRVAGVVCRTPALRERPSDIHALAEHFLREAVGSDPGFAPPVLEYLARRAYPGNVRELRQLVHAMARRYPGAGRLTIGTLPEDERAGLTERDGVLASVGWRGERVDEFVLSALACNVGLREVGRAVEDAAVRIAIDQCGSLRAAAEKLGVSERALQLRRAAARDQAGAPAPQRPA